MAKAAYIGVKSITTFKNMFGNLGNMESTGSTDAEKAYFKTSSQYKYGSGSRAFQQAASASLLTWVFSSNNTPVMYTLNNTHKYYFSVWVMTRYANGMTTEFRWPVDKTPIISGIQNSQLGVWERFSTVFTRSDCANGSYSFRWDTLNHPGNTASSTSAALNIDGVMLVDLTEAFGSGQEPSKKWCDDHIAFSTATSNTYGSDVARKIKKMYIGVNGIARKIKKAYIGVNGIARLFWSGSGEPKKYGTTQALSSARIRIGATSVGDYALFAGGGTSTSTSKQTTTVDTYTSGLTKNTTLTGLTTARYVDAAASLGNYAFFVGGLAGSTASKVVDIYNGSLSKLTNPTNLSYSACYNAGASNSNYAIFAGGVSANTDGVSRKYTYAYNSSAQQASSVESLAKARQGLASATVGDYVLFVGGASSRDVDAYGSSLEKNTNLDVISQTTRSMGAASFGDRALFAGGVDGAILGGTKYDRVYVYDTSLTMTTMIQPLSVARSLPAAVNLGDFVFFTGGAKDSAGSYTAADTVDAYDSQLTKVVFDGSEPLSVARYWHSGTSIGDYALFAGGQGVAGTGIVDTVDVYTI